MKKSTKQYGLAHASITGSGMFGSKETADQTPGKKRKAFVKALAHKHK